MTTLLSAIVIWAMRISAGAVVAFAVATVLYSWRTSFYQPSIPASGRRPAKRNSPGLAAPSLAYTLAVLLGMGWVWAEMRSANKVSRQRLDEVTKQAQTEVDAVYAAAQDPTKQISPENSKQGYVYLGLCDKNWVPGSGRFTRLPSCAAPLPESGFVLISRKGDIIRASPPVTVNGKRQLGSEVARVSAGYSVVLRTMFPVSVFSAGPQYYWGLVDLPTEHPPNAELPVRVPGRRY